MTRIPSAIILLVATVIISCDKNPTTFEDSIPLHTLTTNVYPPNSGTVYPADGDFKTGDRIRIEAQPSEGYVFERWDNDLTGSSNPDIFVVRANSSVKAHFLKRNYDLNIEVNGQGLVRETVMQLSSNSESDTTDISVHKLKLEAEAENEWNFDRWEGDLNGNENPIIVSLESLKDITAIFEKNNANEYTINIDTTGMGVIDIYPDRKIYKKGTEVILTAIADSGWSFKSWEGDLNGYENSQTVKIEENIVATAHFDIRSDRVAEVSRQPFTSSAGSPVAPAPQLHVKDGRGNPITNANITVSLNKNNFSADSKTSIHTNSNGVAEFNDLFIETASSGYVLSFEFSDSTIANISSKPFEVISADPDPSLSKVDVPPESSVGESTEVLIKLHDKFGNMVQGGNSDLLVAVTGSNNATPDVKKKLSGAYSAKYTPTVLGVDQISVSIDGSEISGSPFTSNVGVGQPAGMEIIQQPATTTAGTSLSPAPTIKLMDDFGNVIENVEVTAKLDGAAFAPGSSTVTKTNSDGVAQFTNLKIHSARSGFALSFNSKDVNTTSDNFDIISAAADPSSSRADISSGITGRESEVVIKIHDTFGNGIIGAREKLSVNVNGSNSSSPIIIQNGEAGEYIAKYTPARVGNDIVDIQYNGESVGNSPYKKTVYAADVHPVKSSVIASPEKVITENKSIVTVQPRDINGIPIGGLSASDFNINVRGDASIENLAEASALGTYTFDVTSGNLGDVMLSVSVNGTKLVHSPVVTFIVGEPHEAIIVNQPGHTPSGLPVTGPPAIKVYDKFGRVVPGVDVHVKEKNNNISSNSDLIATTNQSGLAVFDNLFIHNTNEWHTLIFSIKGIEEVISTSFLVTDESL